MALGRNRKGFDLLCRLHRADYCSIANRAAERLARTAVDCSAQGRDHAVLRVYDERIAHPPVSPLQQKFLADPQQLLGTLAMVLKPATDREKGVLLLQYSFSFPLFAKLFDLQRVAEKYYLVLEPDWSGYCDLNVLIYSRYAFPVFVQAFEPRDAEFVTGLNSNLVAVPISANWWVDHRLFFPMPEVQKDIDVAMVAGWGHYKRHSAFFAAISKLRRSGKRLRILLLGYPMGSTLSEILQLARYYGIDDQVEAHEWVPMEEVNRYLNRAKVNALWSRREGVNRAIIEAMFADIPCVIRRGFNYGYQYPYVNSATGCFASERELPQKLEWMTENYRQFAPRDWVLQHMTCQRAAEILSDRIGQVARARGEQWSGGVAAKINKLHGVVYWDPAVQSKFDSDYSFLRSAMRP